MYIDDLVAIPTAEDLAAFTTEFQSTQTAGGGGTMHDLLDWLIGTGREAYQVVNPPDGYHVDSAGRLVQNQSLMPLLLIGLVVLLVVRR
jgi:hypothetical protein